MAIAINDHRLGIVLEHLDVLNEQGVALVVIEQQCARDVRFLEVLAQSRINPQHVALPALVDRLHVHLIGF